jgi:hypothetical protein
MLSEVLYRIFNTPINVLIGIIIVLVLFMAYVITDTILDYKLDSKYAKIEQDGIDNVTETNRLNQDILENKKNKSIMADHKTYLLFSEILVSMVNSYLDEYIELQLRDAMLYKGKPVLDTENDEFKKCCLYVGEQVYRTMSDKMKTVLLDIYTIEGLDTYISSLAMTGALAFYKQNIKSDIVKSQANARKKIIKIKNGQYRL